MKIVNKIVKPLKHTMKGKNPANPMKIENAKGKTSCYKRVSSSSCRKIMKSKNGTGLKKSFKNLVAIAKKRLQKEKPKCRKLAIDLAFAAIKELASDSKTEIPRVIPLPKTGGFLPLLSIVTGLSAAGALVKRSSTITKMLNKIKNAHNTWKAMKNLNETFEPLSVGNGLQLKPYKDGLGLYSSSKN